MKGIDPTSSNIGLTGGIAFTTDAPGETKTPKTVPPSPSATLPPGAASTTAAPPAVQLAIHAAGVDQLRSSLLDKGVPFIAATNPDPEASATRRAKLDQRVPIGVAKHLTAEQTAQLPTLYHGTTLAYAQLLLGVGTLDIDRGPTVEGVSLFLTGHPDHARVYAKGPERQSTLKTMLQQLDVPTPAPMIAAQATPVLLEIDPKALAACGDAFVWQLTDDSPPAILAIPYLPTAAVRAIVPVK